jgi:hypothetical protein
VQGGFCLPKAMSANWRFETSQWLGLFDGAVVGLSHCCKGLVGAVQSAIAGWVRLNSSVMVAVVAM